MNCPRDGEALAARTINDVTVEHCTSCGGMYLERGELNRVADPTSGDLEFSTIDLDTFQHDDEYGRIECPRDPGTSMKKVEFVTATNIILDYCETCGGFWVDGRELARINEEVKDFNEAAKEIPDPPMLRFAQFIWSLPFPR
ncbi:MAG TPA: zf-TFIIB domain-containing protein [Thermoanaerobaculia bacterium]|nr:zf-TFIIB domain-containing protein [Thermoanaerobaculia bacterium]